MELNKREINQFGNLHGAFKVIWKQLLVHTSINRGRGLWGLWHFRIRLTPVKYNLSWTNKTLRSSSIYAAQRCICIFRLTDTAVGPGSGWMRQMMGIQCDSSNATHSHIHTYTCSQRASTEKRVNFHCAFIVAILCVGWKCEPSRWCGGGGGVGKSNVLC